MHSNIFGMFKLSNLLLTVPRYIFSKLSFNLSRVRLNNYWKCSRKVSYNICCNETLTSWKSDLNISRVVMMLKELKVLFKNSFFNFQTSNYYDNVYTITSTQEIFF